MFFSPKAWLTIVGCCVAMLGLLFNWESGVPGLSYFSGDDSQIRGNLAQQAAQHVVLELSKTPSLSNGRPSVAIANAVDDYRGLVTNQLKTWMGRRNVSVINEERIVSFANLFNRRPTTVAESVAPLLGAGAEFIIATDIDNWTTYPEYQAKLIGTVYLFDSQGNQLLTMSLSPAEAAAPLNGVRNTTYTTIDRGDTDETSVDAANPIDIPGSVKAIASRGQQSDRNNQASIIPGIQITVMGWIAMVFLGPWILRTPIQRVLYRRDNRVNAQMLLAWGGTCGGLLWILMTLGGLSVITTSVSVLAGIMACAYFGYVCEKLEESL